MPGIAVIFAAAAVLLLDTSPAPDGAADHTNTLQTFSLVTKAAAGNRRSSGWRDRSYSSRREQRRVEEEQRRREAERRREEERRRDAERRREAERQRAEAERQRAEVERQRAQAERQRAEAERARRQANSRQMPPQTQSAPPAKTPTASGNDTTSAQSESNDGKSSGNGAVASRNRGTYSGASGPAEKFDIYNPPSTVVGLFKQLNKQAKPRGAHTPWASKGLNKRPQRRAGHGSGANISGPFRQARGLPTHATPPNRAAPNRPWRNPDLLHASPSRPSFHKNRRNFGPPAAHSPGQGTPQFAPEENAADKNSAPPQSDKSGKSDKPEPPITPAKKQIAEPDKDDLPAKAGKDKQLPENANANADKPNNAPAKTITPALAKTKSKGHAPVISFGSTRGVPAFLRDEVVALGLSKADLHAARKLGFGVAGSDSLDSLGMAVTRLVAPKGVSAPKALAMLKERAGMKGALNLNHVYHAYHTARRQEADTVDLGEPLAAPGKEAKMPSVFRPGKGPMLRKPFCNKGKCFGRFLVNWKDQLSQCSTGLAIGVIDTSVDYRHSAFDGRRISVGNFLPRGRSKTSDSHGTSILALLAGSPKSQTPGLIPDAKFYTADVFYADDKGEAVTDSVTLLKALDWMDAWNVKIINMSFAGPQDPLIEKVIAKMSAKGVVFVAAAGNDGPAAPPRYPAAYDPVVAVTAVSKTMSGYRYANRGSYIDLAAPGVRVWTAMPGQKGGFQSGTSYAVPFVTAAMATIYRDAGPDANAQTLINRLSVRDLGPNGTDPIYGRGLVMAPTSCSKGGENQTSPVADASLLSPQLSPKGAAFVAH